MASRASGNHNAVAGPQRLISKADFDELSPVVQFQPPPLRGTIVGPDVTQDEWMRIDEVQFSDDGLDGDSPTGVVDRRDGMMRLERHANQPGRADDGRHPPRHGPIIYRLDQR